MAKIIGLPKLSPTMEEGTLVAWTKKEGDEVDVDDLLAEVETDKATMEFRSFDRGVLLKILVPEGETLEPDVPVAIIGKAGENIDELLAQIEAAAVSKSASESESAPESAPESVSAAAPASASVSAPVSVPVSASASGRVLSFSLSSAGWLGSAVSIWDPCRVAGRMGGSSSGISTRMRGPVGGTVALPGERLPPRVEKASSMRRTIARRLTESMQTIPHYYLTVDVDIAPLSDARKR